MIFVFTKTLWSLEASILREQGERPTSHAREGSPVGGRGTADPASLQNPTGVNVESLLSAGESPTPLVLLILLSFLASSFRMDTYP